MTPFDLSAISLGGIVRRKYRSYKTRKELLRKKMSCVCQMSRNVKRAHLPGLIQRAMITDLSRRTKSVVLI